MYYINMIQVNRSNKHFHKEDDWLSTDHHFSFAEYFDPKKMNFGPLRVFNDDIIKAGKGFDFHFHRDMEIVTYVVEGELKHEDNQGNRGVIYPGEVQRMTAGSGIMHSEYNRSEEKPLRLLQVWIFTDTGSLSPSWEQKKYSKEQRLNKLLPVVVPMNGTDSSIDNALHIHQDASLYISTLTPGTQVNHELKAERKAYVFIIDGEITLNGNIMQARDAVKLENENRISIKAVKPTELVLIDLPEKYAINR